MFGVYLLWGNQSGFNADLTDLFNLKWFIVSGRVFRILLHCQIGQSRVLTCTSQMGRNFIMASSENAYANGTHIHCCVSMVHFYLAG